MIKIGASVLATAMFCAAMSIGARSAVADDVQDANQLSEKARLTFESFIKVAGGS